MEPSCARVGDVVGVGVACRPRPACHMVQKSPSLAGGRAAGAGCGSAMGRPPSCCAASCRFRFHHRCCAEAMGLHWCGSVMSHSRTALNLKWLLSSSSCNLGSGHERFRHCSSSWKKVFRPDACGFSEGVRTHVVSLASSEMGCCFFLSWSSVVLGSIWLWFSFVHSAPDDGCLFFRWVLGRFGFVTKCLDVGFSTRLDADRWKPPTSRNAQPLRNQPLQKQSRNCCDSGSQEAWLHRI